MDSGLLCGLVLGIIFFPKSFIFNHVNCHDTWCIIALYKPYRITAVKTNMNSKKIIGISSRMMSIQNTMLSVSIYGESG